MKKLFTLAIGLLLYVSGCLPLVAQVKPQNHSVYLKLLGSAKESLYQQSLKTYDQYIQQHPSDYLMQIERCRFIENACNTEEYNPKYAEVEQEVNRLMKKFPNTPEVMLYKSELLYGDSAITFLEAIVLDYKKNPGKWQGKAIWRAYDNLASSYAVSEKPDEAIKYGELAMALNDTLDLSYLIANAYKAKNQKKKAINLVLSHLDSTDKSWELNQKGKLLLELGVPQKALLAFNLAKKDSASYQDGEGMAEALIQTGLYQEARAFLVRNATAEYSNAEDNRKLFQYDLQYSPVDSAKVSYQRLVKENFWADALGVYRLQLFWRAPLLPWTFPDILRIILIVVLAGAILVVPYIWVLPVYFAGNFLKNRGLVLSPTPFRWTLKHFWIISSLLVLINVLVEVIYQYSYFLSGYDISSTEPISQHQANKTLFFLTGMLVITILLLKRSDLTLIWGNLWAKKRSIFTGIGLALALKTGLGIYLAVLKIAGFGFNESLTFLSITDSIRALNQYYHPGLGFLFVVCLVPFYEEIMFRGIFLASCEKHIRFFIANSLQAFTFALIHQQLKLIPFYFAFGYLAGYYRRKSQSLAPGISMHVTNNFLAFLALLLKP